MSIEDVFQSLSGSYEMAGRGRFRLHDEALEPFLAVGIMILQETQPDPGRSVALELELLMVVPSYRHKGIGRRMMRDLCAAADDAGVDLVLSVVPGPSMDATMLFDWYERLGFALRPDLCFADDTVMVREFVEPAIEPAL